MRSTVLTLGALSLAVVAVIVAMKLAATTGAVDLVQGLQGWIEELGVFGFLVFVIVSGVAVVFFFPGSILMTASGAAFGLGWGFVAALAATTLGAGLAFLVSRYLARTHVERWVSSRPRFAAVDEAIGEQGWKIVILTRCCPIFPYIFQNYAYGLTRVRFGHYALGSFIGLVPAVLVFVYMGSLGRSGAEAAEHGASALELGLRVLGFVATVGVSIYITRISARALEREGL